MMYSAPLRRIHSVEFEPTAVTRLARRAAALDTGRLCEVRGPPEGFNVDGADAVTDRGVFSTGVQAEIHGSVRLAATDSLSGISFRHLFMDHTLQLRASRST